MARHEGDFRRGAQELLNLSGIIPLLGEAAEGDRPSREDAIACYLSGGEGWREAVKALGGTFAKGNTGLRERKDD